MTHQQQYDTHYVFIRISLLCLFLSCCQIAGAGVQWKRHAIADLPDRAMFIQASDVDSDSRPDLIAGGWWWKNPGHLGGTWKQSTIGEPLRNMAIVYDFDVDGVPTFSAPRVSVPPRTPTSYGPITMAKASSLFTRTSITPAAVTSFRAARLRAWAKPFELHSPGTAMAEVSTP